MEDLLTTVLLGDAWEVFRAVTGTAIGIIWLIFGFLGLVHGPVEFARHSALHHARTHRVRHFHDTPPVSRLAPRDVAGYNSDGIE